MDRHRGQASAAGVVAGVAALASSYAVAMVLTSAAAPFVRTVVALAGLIPMGAREHVLAILGGADTWVVGLLLAVAYAALAAWSGRLRAQRGWAALLLWLLVWALLALAGLAEEDPAVKDVLPVVAGFVAAVAVLEIFQYVPPAALPGAGSAGTDAPSRRGFVVASAAVLVASAAAAGLGGVIGAARRSVAERRLLVRLEGLTRPRVPPRADLGVAGVAPWQTPTEDFFVHHRGFAPPTVDPAEWRLRIHGLVEREVLLSYQDLLARGISESWSTLVCERNEVGGDQVGNAWWSGVRTSEVLREAQLDPRADCVVQTGVDGWRCATPLEALMDERDSLLVLGMNGRPLTIEHGFPVRTMVPGLFGHVSATKWVRDLEVTTYDALSAEDFDDGWSLRGPIRSASRIDVPQSGATVNAGRVSVGGVAWTPMAAVARVEVSLDGGPWAIATLGETTGPQSWVQWHHEFDLLPGEHVLVVRATDEAGLTQTSVQRDPQPDGATGWHRVEFDVAPPAD